MAFADVTNAFFWYKFGLIWEPFGDRFGDNMTYLLKIPYMFFRRMRTVTNMYIANLAFADVTIALFAIPFQFHAALLQVA